MDTEKIENDFFFTGFWVRLFAFLIDIFVLSILGAFLSLFFKDCFYKIGEDGWWIGFIISGIYATLCYGKIGQGQTIGKRFLKLQIITSDGTILPYHRAFLRYLIIALVIYNQGIGSLLFGEIKPSTEFELFTDGYYIFIFVIATGILVLLAFHSRKIGLHDLIVKTCVIKKVKFEYYKDRVSITSFDNPKKNRIAYIIYVLTLLIASVIFILLTQLIKTKHPEDLKILLNLSSKIENEIKVKNVNITLRHFRSQFESSNDLTVNAYVHKEIFDDKQRSHNYANNIRKIIARSYPSIKQIDNVIIYLRTGFNIGIFRFTKSNFYKFNANEFKKIDLGKMDIPSDLASPQVEAEAYKHFAIAQNYQYKRYLTEKDRQIMSEDKEKMLKEYQAVADKYPESQYADECLYWIAFYYDMDIGDKQKALEIYQDAIKKYSNRSKTSSTIAHIYRNMGRVLKEQGKYNEAILTLKNSVKAYQDYINNPTNGEQEIKGMQHQMGYEYVNIGKIYEDFLGKYDKALLSYKEAEKSFKNAGYPTALDAAAKVRYDIERVSRKIR